MEARCEIRQQVMAASFSVHYYGALRDSDKAGMIIDIVFAIADIVTGDTFCTQLPRYRSARGFEMRCSPLQAMWRS